MPIDSATPLPTRPAIEIDGQPMPALDAGLVSLEIVEQSAGPYHCDVRFVNWGAREGTMDYLYFDRQTLEFGKRLVVKLGTDSLFAGRIFALEAHFPGGPAPQIAALASDRLQDLRMTRRTRTFTNLSDADLAQRIAKDHGLEPHVEIAGPRHRVLAQLNQSDFALLQDRARAVGAEVWVDGDRLFAQPRSARRGTPLALAIGAQLRSCTVLADLAHQRTAISASGWDVSRKTGITYPADARAVDAELGDMESGAAVLAGAFGARMDSVVDAGPATLAEARAIAEAAFRATARRFVTVRGVAERDARLRVGAVVDLGGLGPLFSGAYDLVEIRHRFDSVEGLRTEFIAERAGIGHAN